MTTAQNPGPADERPDVFGGPDPGGEEDEFAEPGPPGQDTFGGPDPGDREDELRPPT